MKKSDLKLELIRNKRKQKDLNKAENIGWFYFVIAFFGCWFFLTTVSGLLFNMVIISSCVIYFISLIIKLKDKRRVLNEHKWDVEYKLRHYDEEE